MLQGRLQGMRGADVEARASELLETFGLAEKADALVKTYSRRHEAPARRRHRPRSTARRCCSSTSRRPGSTRRPARPCGRSSSALAAAERLTILLTTHYLEEADRLAERVAIVSRGRVVVEGRPEELKRELRGDAVTVELVRRAGERAPCRS